LRGASARFEDVLHQFAATIASADDPATVESALLKLAHRMAPASRIELIAGPATAAADEPPAEACSSATGIRASDRWNKPTGQMALEVPLRSGASICGRLRLRSRSGGRTHLRQQTIQRLATLCTMAASAMECVGNHAEWRRDDEAGNRVGAPSSPAASSTTETPTPPRPAIPLHDATFVSAVLPFALNQARRHREALSLLCVAIDRQTSLQELLGSGEVDRMIRHVGEVTGSLIRTSDIVARLDDDRIIAILPRAPRGGALRVAESICRAVAKNRLPDCSVPNPTVSIGVATFPSCADNVYALFDAADEALAWAQNHGRNRAVLAPPRAPRVPSPAPDKSVGCSA
jgi:diguanylate cyclase (GGDEF)-like protein